MGADLTSLVPVTPSAHPTTAIDSFYPSKVVEMADNADFSTSISYLARLPLYQKEKPYSADFDPGDGNHRTNHVFDDKTVTIHQVDSTRTFDLNVNGFCMLRSEPCFRAENALQNPRDVEEACFAEAEALLHYHFPEYERIDAMSMTVCVLRPAPPCSRSRESHHFEFLQVRKRDERFPVPAEAKPVPVSHEQPATIPHCDFSLFGKDVQLEMSFPGQTEYFKSKDFDLLK
jgi:hypothetical protein